MDTEFGHLFKPAKPNGKGVIYCHEGFGKLGPKGFYPLPLTLSTIKGYTALAIDYSPELDIREDLKRVDRAAAYLKNAFDLRWMSVIGYSRGGLVAFHALPLEIFNGGVIVAGPTDLKNYEKIQNPEAKKFINYLSALPYPIKMAKELSVKPLLLLYGTEDDLVPPSQGSRMATAIENYGTKCRLQYVMHGHDLMKYQDSWAAIANWLGKQ